MRLVKPSDNRRPFSVTVRKPGRKVTEIGWAVGSALTGRCEGCGVGRGVGAGLGSMVDGASVGFTVVGAVVGDDVGDFVGDNEGSLVGARLVIDVINKLGRKRANVGLAVGIGFGLLVGERVLGEPTGDSVTATGLAVRSGKSLGNLVGTSVCALVGDRLFDGGLLVVGACEFVGENVGDPDSTRSR